MSAWFGGGLLDQGLTEEERRALQMQALMQGGAAMLQGSGYSDVPITTGQALGAAMGAAQGAYGKGAASLSEQRAQQRAAAEEARKAAEEAAYIASLSPTEQMAARYPSLANIATKQWERENPEVDAAATGDVQTQTVNGVEYYRSGDSWKPVPRSARAGAAGGAGSGSAAAPKLSVMEKRADELADYEAATGEEVDEETGRFYLRTGKFPDGTKAGGKAGKEAEGKAGAAASMAVPIENIRNVLDDGLSTGGVFGLEGQAQKLFNRDRATFFDNQIQQLSADLRQIFRIPGEGSLSDYEAKQYGIQLPSLNYSPEVNKQVLQSIEQRVAARIGSPNGGATGGPPGSAPPATGTAGAPTPEEIEAELRRRGLM